jgi:hypothetical protein
MQPKRVSNMKVGRVGVLRTDLPNVFNLAKCKSIWVHWETQENVRKDTERNLLKNKNDYSLCSVGCGSLPATATE